MTKREPKPFIFGWEEDEELGERLIQDILAGRKTATSGPASDPEDADVVPGDLLNLMGKDGKPRALLEATRVEIRDYETFNEALAAAEGTTLEKLQEGTAFANGGAISPDEPMRVIHFKLIYSLNSEGERQPVAQTSIKRQTTEPGNA